MAQAARRGHWVSILAYTQNPTGYSPGQPALSDPAQAGSSQPLLFCDSV